MVAGSSAACPRGFASSNQPWLVRFVTGERALHWKEALDNLLSAFRGTHFVSPRSYPAELGFHS
jgi:hypothetical protein